MARLSKAHRSAIGRAVRSYHRTVRAIVRANPGTGYRHAQQAYKTLAQRPDLGKPTSAFIRDHPRLTRAAVRSVPRNLRRVPDRVSRERVDRAEAISAIAPASRDVEAYQDAPFSPAREIKDIESLDTLIDYFDGLDDFDDYNDIEVEANADYEEK